MRLWIVRALALGAAIWALGSSANPVRTPHVAAELVAERSAIQAGQVMQVGLSLIHQPGWHTYWLNPGDSGLPTRLTWRLPLGSQIGEIEWPVPQRLPVGPLMNYGYEGELLLPLSFTPPPSAKPGDMMVLNARADWLACKEVCIPESVELELLLPVVGQDVTPGITSATPAFASNAAAQSQPLKGWTSDLEYVGQDALLVLKSMAAKPPDVLPSIQVFPHAAQLFESAYHEVYQTAEGYAVKLRLLPDAAMPKTLRSTVVAPTTNPGELTVWGMSASAGEIVADAKAVSQLNTPPQLKRLPNLLASTQLSQPTQSGLSSIWAALGMALLGGMALNLMPCVLPVLSIKLLSLTVHHDSRSPWVHALAYSLGIVLTFLAMASVLLALREAGGAIGWGFQLQEPGVVFGLAVLFFLLGLNFLGAFELGSVTPQVLGRWRAQQPAVDAFASGVLAVVAASPCTAPFMGAALGFALTQPTAVSLTVFATLGAGMALPYAALTLLPRWRHCLPRPGQWMIRLKQGLAFPMFATVVWLLWVLGQQSGIDEASKVLLVLLGVAWLVWMLNGPRQSKTRHWFWRTLLLMALVGLITWGWPSVQRNENFKKDQLIQNPAASWKDFDEAALSDHLARNETVFIDFTAAWCVTCQVNKRLVLNSKQTLQDFANAKVVLMRADWTDRNPQITATLARLGRHGVPTYVLLRPGKEPELLPEVLSSRRVREALLSPGP